MGCRLLSSCLRLFQKAQSPADPKSLSVQCRAEDYHEEEEEEENETTSHEATFLPNIEIRPETAAKEPVE